MVTEPRHRICDVILLVEKQFYALFLFTSFQNTFFKENLNLYFLIERTSEVFQLKQNFNVFSSF